MPIELPSGVRAIPVRQGTVPALAGIRITSFRFDLLDGEENLLRTLRTVEGGSVDWTNATAIKGGGRMTVADKGPAVDWVNVRIRPTAILEGSGESPLGVFLASAPSDDWDATGRTWDIELLDKLSILDTDTILGADGNPVTPAFAAGANILDTVRAIILGAGEAAPAIGTGPKVLANAMTWEIGTSRLKMINDLLEAAGYASLWTDGVGQYRAEPYVTPALRTPVYESLAPFVKGETSLMSPQWRRDRDIYGVPNRYIAVGQGDGTTEALTAVATNIDPASPFSFQARGDRWITETVTGVEAATLADLQTRAQMGLAAASSITSSLDIAHAYLPDLRINEVVPFRNDDAGLDFLCYVTKTEIPFDPLALCKTTIREAVV